MEPGFLRECLAATCRKRFGGEVQVSDLQPLTAGASAATWRFDLAEGGGTRPIILQLFAGGKQFFSALDKRTQGLVQQQANEAGILTPKVLFVLDDSDGLGKGFAMEFVAGETLGHRIVRDDRFEAARPVMARQCGSILGAIHAIDFERLDGLRNVEPSAMVQQLYDAHRSFGEDLPVFELAFQYLAHHAPQPEKSVLLHGDFRNGNLIVDETGIVAVLDWELAHIGDPHEDLAWLCVNAWRFGAIDKPVGGFGTRQDMYEAYESASDNAVDPGLVRYWEVFGALKWGVICQWFGEQFVSGEVRELERAAIGRRTSETELDLLDLLEGIG